MVKVFKSIFLAFSLIALAGCSNLAGVINSPENDSQTSHKITAFITEDCNAVLNSSSRSILPDSIPSNSLYYYLSVEDLYSHHIYNPTTNLELSKSGSSYTFDFDYPMGYYNFVIYATKAPLAGVLDRETLRQAAVLWGQTDADLRNKEKVSFSLSSKGLPGRGTIALSLYSTEDWQINYDKYNMMAYLKRTDGSLIESQQIYNLPSGVVPPTPQYYSQTPSGFEQGTYIFELAFINRITNKIYTYETEIYILPNQNTEKAVAISNLIEYEPNAPADFKASFKEAENLLTDSYEVNFTWTDMSNNEYYFELDLLEINDSANEEDISPQNIWTSEYLMSLKSIGKITTYSKDVTSKPEYVAGSLQRSKTSLTLSLDLGKRYLARICAVNDAGKSVYSYLDLSAGGTGTAGFTAFAADSHCINRYRMTYNLNGGTLTYSDGTPDATGSIVSYHTQGETVPVLTPDTAPVVTITSDTKNFESWTKGGVGGTLFNETSYSGFTNLDLYAKYQE